MVASADAMVAALYLLVHGQVDLVNPVQSLQELGAAQWGTQRIW